MSDDIEILRRIKRLERALNLSPEEILGLQVDLAAAIFLRDASAEHETNLFLKDFPGVSKLINSLAVGAVYKLKLQGVSKETAVRYIEDRLGDLERKLAAERTANNQEGSFRAK